MWDATGIALLESNDFFNPILADILGSVSRLNLLRLNL
jgi:hypothetical protein